MGNKPSVRHDFRGETSESRCRQVQKPLSKKGKKKNNKLPLNENTKLNSKAHEN